MIVLVGTGHVFDLTQALIDIFDEKDPDVICVELDKNRYHALLSKRADPKSYENSWKNAPFIYRLLSRFQDSMAKQYGVRAGDEMIAAIDYAKTHQIQLELIDMDAQKLFTNMLRSMSFSEKIRLLLSGFGGFFISKKRVEEELKKVENEFDKYINEIGKKFPTIKKTLIDDRNIYMKNKLIDLSKDFKSIVVCIGDGHIPGISDLLKQDNIEFNTIRLSDLQNFERKEKDNTVGYFSTEYNGY